VGATTATAPTAGVITEPPPDKGSRGLNTGRQHRSSPHTNGSREHWTARHAGDVEILVAAKPAGGAVPTQFMSSTPVLSELRSGLRDRQVRARMRGRNGVAAIAAGRGVNPVAQQ